MEEHIEQLLKEKEAAQLVVTSVKETQMIGADLISSPTDLASSLATGETTRLSQELQAHKQKNEKLLQKFQTLESQKVKNDTLYVEEMQKSQRLGLKVKQLERKTLMAETLAQDKEDIWLDISHSITEVWSSIQIIFEQQELIAKCRAEIET